VIGRISASSAILWLAFLLCCALTLNNLHQNPLTLPFNQIDEQGHISYALHLITHDRWWPDFSHFMMFDVPTQTELKALNYINHPPTFYWLIKLAHTALPWWEPIHFRAVALVIYLGAMLMYTRIGIALVMPIPSSILYALTPLLVYMYLQIGFYNNDAMCVLGGMIATLASLRWFRGEQPQRAILWMGLGVLLASVKLTALLLVGFYVMAAALMRLSTIRSLPKHYIIYGMIAAILCTAPYFYMMLTFGSPAPNTPGQLAKLQECLQCNSQGIAQHMDFLSWLPFFLSKFADQLSVAETTYLPIFIYAAALIAIFVSAKRPAILHRENAIYTMAIASAIATVLTLGIHIFFSWQRYSAYGWIFDSILRYYLPLIGAYAGVSACALERCGTRKKGPP